MRIVGLGVDLAEIDRVRRLLGKYPGKFMDRVFTEHEQRYAGRFADPAARLAARFAGKEAVMKSLGAGWRRIRWRDIEITGGGAPRVNLFGSAARRADVVGATDVMVTITHTDDRALVMAVAVTDDTTPERPSSESGFRDLLDVVAEGWMRGHPDLALRCFTEDAVYMEPPDRQLFVGHEELRRYFAVVEPGTEMLWRHLLFDPQHQVGVGEFTFGRPDAEERTHGVAVVHLRDGRIARWEEYHRPGPTDRARFLSVEGKEWRWHGGNFP